MKHKWSPIVEVEGVGHRRQCLICHLTQSANYNLGELTLRRRWQWWPYQGFWYGKKASPKMPACTGTPRVFEAGPAQLFKEVEALQK